MARENIQRIIDGLMLLAEGKTSKGCHTLEECAASDLREAAVAISVLARMGVLNTPLAGPEEGAAQVDRTIAKKSSGWAWKRPQDLALRIS